MSGTPRPAPERGRRAARRAAVFVLYQKDVTDLPVGELEANARRAGEPLDDFARGLVAGVTADRAGIDAAIGAAAEGWTVERIAPLERSILRVAVHEIRAGGVPAAVAIDEAVELAKRYCQAEAAAFVNGVLGAVARSAGGGG
ncbi:MAG: transcription antitermination factor NusB [Actinomycetota bacterium]